MSADSTTTGALKRTPLYDQHKELGARLVEFAGWEMPVQYGGVIEEHRAVRERAGLFDVSHMGELPVVGEGALDFLQSMVPNDVASWPRIRRSTHSSATPTAARWTTC